MYTKYINDLLICAIFHFQVIALGSKSLERCKDFKAKHGLMDAKTYGSYEDFYKDPEIGTSKNYIFYNLRIIF